MTWDMKNEPRLTRIDRFRIGRKLADTLQGHIYKAYDNLTKSDAVVKQTYIQLVEQGITRDLHPVPEDFKKEKRVMTLLSSKSAAPRPKESKESSEKPTLDTTHPEEEECGFVRMIYDWEDNDSYYYAMQYCEGELFMYTSRAFDNPNGKIYKQMKREQAPEYEQRPLTQPNEWMSSIQHIFRQLVRCMAWMHSLGVCHLDLSLENTMIFNMDQLIVKIIDFGLAMQFNPKNKSKNNYRYNRRVGKRGYMAPEVYRQHTYDCRKADIWSLGVMLFMMLVGAPPYKKPHAQQDPAFGYIMQGRLADVLAHWKRVRMVTKDALDLMLKIFRPENKRITMQEMLAHPYINMPDYLQPELECDGSIVVERCPSIYRVITALMTVQEANGRLNSSLIKQYDNIKLLDDFNHVIDDHIRGNQSVHEKLSHVLMNNFKTKTCNIENCVMMQRNYRNRKLDCEAVFKQLYGKDALYGHDRASYSFIKLQILDKIHCYFAHSTEIGHKIRLSDIEELINNSNSNSNSNNNSNNNEDGDDYSCDLATMTKICQTKLNEMQASLQSKPILNDVEDIVQLKMAKYCTRASDLKYYEFKKSSSSSSSSSNSNSNSMNRDDDSKEAGPRRLDQNVMLNHRAQLQYAYFGDIKQAIINRIDPSAGGHELNPDEFLQLVKDLRKTTSQKLLKKLSDDQWSSVLEVVRDDSNMDEPLFRSLTPRDFGKFFKIKPVGIPDGTLLKLHKKLKQNLNSQGNKTPKRGFSLKKKKKKESQIFLNMQVPSIVENVHRTICDLLGNSLRKNFDNDKLLRLFEYYQINGSRFLNHLTNDELLNLLNECLLCGRMDNFAIGFRYNYWSRNVQHEQQQKIRNLYNGQTKFTWYVRPKYQDLKAEMLQNGMNPFQFTNIVIYVTEYMMKTMVYRKIRAVVEPFLDNDEYQSINNGDKIPAARLVSMFIYTNYHFIMQSLVQSYIDGPIQHRAFANIARYLRETVDCYGRDQQSQKFSISYHVMDKHIVLPNTNIRFCNAMSTCKELNVALAVLACYEKSGSNLGVVLDLTNSETRNRSFDLYWVSDMPYEEENVFIGGLNCHQIVSVRILNAKVKSEKFIMGIAVLYELIHGRVSRRANGNISKFVTESIEQLISYRLAQRKMPQSRSAIKLHNTLYRHGVFAAFCESITNWVTIDLGLKVKDNCYNSLFNLVCVHAESKRIRFNVILNLFPLITKIIVRLDAESSRADKRGYVLDESLRTCISMLASEQGKERSPYFQCFQFENIATIQTKELDSHTKRVSKEGWKYVKLSDSTVSIIRVK